jgi:hypothetical protein
MLNIEQFRTYIIRPVLDDLHLFSKSAEELLVFTCAVESNGGTYVHQIKGPALGIFQCEPSTHDDIWYNYLKHNMRHIHRLNAAFDVTGIPDASRLIHDLRYASAMARFHYLRVPEKLPAHDDVEGLYSYYKEHYNTKKGKSVKDKSIAAYESFLKSA